MRYSTPGGSCDCDEGVAFGAAEAGSNTSFNEAVVWGLLLPR